MRQKQGNFVGWPQSSHVPLMHNSCAMRCDAIPDDDVGSVLPALACGARGLLAGPELFGMPVFADVAVKRSW